MTFTSINYHSLLDHMIKDCISHAYDYPFERHYFICDNPSIVEQLFFKYTHTLVNIEVLSFKDYLKEMINEYHYNNQVIINNTQLTYLLRKVLSEQQFKCFSNDQPYALIDKFIPIIKTYDLYELDYNIEHNKLNDLLILYKSVKNLLNTNEHLTIESLFDHCLFNHEHSTLYIDGSQLYTKKHIHIIDQLKKNHNVHMFYTYTDDNRLCNLPYADLINDYQSVCNNDVLLDQLFLENISDKDHRDGYYYYIASTLHNEVKYAVYSLYQRIADEGLHYNDFAIVYPSSDYIRLLINTLDSLNIPHNIPYTHDCVYEKCYTDILNDKHIYQFSAFNQFAEYYLSLDLDSSYISYFEQLLDYTDKIDAKEFLLFFKNTYKKSATDVNKNKDVVSICSIDDVMFDHSKHVYFLGLNETVLARRIKDTALLLDEDLELLEGVVPFNTSKVLGLHHNNILKALSFPCLSTTFSYSRVKLSGETLLESSLFKQLNTILSLNKAKEPVFKAVEDFYLEGGSYSDRDVINDYIDDFIKSKNNVSQIDKDFISSLYSDHLSVSQIETYNKCPFMYFIKYGLNINIPFSYELQANELGSLVHYVLEKCVGCDDYSIDDIVSEYIDDNDVLYKKISESSVNQYFIDLLKEDLKITLYVIKKQREQSLFDIYEKELRIKGKLDDLSFKGFVDRVDVYNDYVSIVDYKSSAKDIDLNLAIQGFNIQMLVYLKMVTESLNKKPGAVLYFNTKSRVLQSSTELYEPINTDDFYKQYRLNGYLTDNNTHDVIKAIDTNFDKRSNIVNVSYVKSKGEYKGNLLSEESLKILFDYIVKHIHTLYSEMINGHVEISPKGSDNSSVHAKINPCTYCDYKCICNFDYFYNEYKNVEFLDVDKMLGGEEDAV